MSLSDRPEAVKKLFPISIFLNREDTKILFSGFECIKILLPNRVTEFIFSGKHMFWTLLKVTLTRPISCSKVRPRLSARVVFRYIEEFWDDLS